MTELHLALGLDNYTLNTDFKHHNHAIWTFRCSHALRLTRRILECFVGVSSTESR